MSIFESCSFFFLLSAKCFHLRKVEYCCLVNACLLKKLRFLCIVKSSYTICVVFFFGDCFNYRNDYIVTENKQRLGYFSRNLVRD